MSGSTQLKVLHASLQFSDKPFQQEQDISDLFEHFQQYPIKTFTESGPENANHRFLIEYAKEYRHHLFFARSNAIAVSKAIVKDGTLERGIQLIARNDETWGKGHDTVTGWLEFDHEDDRIGHVTQAATHNPLRGAQPGDVNHRITLRAARMNSRLLARHGAGTSLAFLNGDFNINDMRFDFDLGVGNFTSMADELGKHPDTGHGPIDGMCSYDRDSRVSAKSWKVLDDSKFPQFSDHFVCLGTWDIKHRRK